MTAKEVTAKNFEEMIMNSYRGEHGRERAGLEIMSVLEEEWSDKLCGKTVEEEAIKALVGNLFSILPERVVGFWEWDEEETGLSEQKYQFMTELCQAVLSESSAAASLLEFSAADAVASGMLFLYRSLSYMAQRKGDMESLEMAMRQWEQALGMFAGRASIERQYEISKMHFECVNACLFETHEMFSEAGEYYGRAAKLAKKVLFRLVDCDLILDSEIGEYALQESWNAIVLFGTLYRQHIRIQNVSEALHAAEEVHDYLKKLKPYLMEDAGLCERAARELWALSAAQNNCGDLINAGKTLDETAFLYETLYKTYDNRYAQAMYLQSKVFYYCQLLQQGQPEPGRITELDSERKTMLSSSDLTEFEQNIGESVGVMVELYQGFFAMMREQYVPALKEFRAVTEHVESSLLYFRELSGVKELSGSEELSSSKNRWLASVGQDIRHRLETAQIISTQQAAGCEYLLNDLDEAKKLFEKTLALANDKETALPEINRLRLVTQVYMMLGEIYGKEGDVPQAEFYFGKLASESWKLAEQTNLDADWSTCVHGISFAMEYENQIKKTEKAKSYAADGMRACGRLREVDAGNQALQLEGKFEKVFRKKKGFFFSLFS